MSSDGMSETRQGKARERILMWRKLRGDGNECLKGLQSCSVAGVGGRGVTVTEVETQAVERLLSRTPIPPGGPRGTSHQFCYFTDRGTEALAVFWPLAEEPSSLPQCPGCGRGFWSTGQQLPCRCLLLSPL